MLIDPFIQTVPGAPHARRFFVTCFTESYLKQGCVLRENFVFFTASDEPFPLVLIFIEAFDGCAVEFYTSAEVECTDQEDVVLVKFYGADPCADVVLVERVNRVFVLCAEFGRAKAPLQSDLVCAG